MKFTAPAAPIKASHWKAWDCAVELGGTPIPTIQGIKCVLLNLLSVLSPFLILIAFFFILFAGVRIILGGDDPKQLAGGYKTLTFAIIGIVGLVLAWFVLYLIEQFTGAPVTQLNLTP